MTPNHKCQSIDGLPCCLHTKLEILCRHSSFVQAAYDLFSRFSLGPFYSTLVWQIAIQWLQWLGRRTLTQKTWVQFLLRYEWTLHGKAGMSLYALQGTVQCHRTGFHLLTIYYILQLLWNSIVLTSARIECRWLPCSRAQTCLPRNWGTKSGLLLVHGSSTTVRELTVIWSWPSSLSYQLITRINDSIIPHDTSASSPVYDKRCIWDEYW